MLEYSTSIVLQQPRHKLSQYCLRVLASSPMMRRSSDESEVPAAFFKTCVVAARDIVCLRND